MKYLAIMGTLAASTGAALAFLVQAVPAQAASVITSVTTGTFTDGANSTVNGITYLNQSLSIQQIQTGATGWNTNGFSTTLTLRRSGAGAAPGREVVWEERPTSSPVTTLRGPAPTTTQAALASNNLFVGTDNLFANSGNTSGNQSDVERADFVASSGLLVDSLKAVTVFERGATNAHDGFKIAAITGIDGSGNPTGFGTVVQIAQGWGTSALRVSTQNPAPNPSPNPNYTVLNNSSGGYSNTGDLSGQNIGGILITLNELATVGTTIYGYSLFGSDSASAGCGNLTSLSNTTCYPQNSLEANGGIDLLAANVGIVQAVPEPLNVMGAVMVVGLGIGLKRKLAHSKK